jgi:hypothetical protein
MKGLFAVALICSLAVARVAGVSNYCFDNGIALGVVPHPDPELCDHFLICALYVTYVDHCPPYEIFVPHIGSDPQYGECEPGECFFGCCVWRIKKMTIKKN